MSASTSSNKKRAYNEISDSRNQVEVISTESRGGGAATQSTSAIIFYPPTPEIRTRQLSQFEQNMAFILSPLPEYRRMGLGYFLSLLGNTPNVADASLPRRPFDVRTEALYLGSNEYIRLLETLNSQIPVETSTDIMVLILRILAQMVLVRQLPAELTHGIIKELLLHLTSDSHKVRRQALESLIIIVKNNKNNGNVYNLNESHYAQITSACHTLLHNMDQGVRRRSLQLLTWTSLLSNIPSVQTTLRDFTDDRDPRVRTSAIMGLITLHQVGGVKLDVKLYQQAARALKDDFQGVREQGLNLICIMSNLYPRHVITNVLTNEPVRLVDDCFAKICNMVRDNSQAVRAKACRLLGSIEGISLETLMKTFNDITLHTSSDKHKQGTSSTSLAAPADEIQPEGDVNVQFVDPDSQDLLATGVVGTFITGLQDEYSEVRVAAIESICDLSLRYREFADVAIDALVEMFNDEIDAVRITAFKSVSRMGSFVQLKEDQLQIVLAILDDASPKIRQAVHHLLGHIKVSNTAGLHATVRALLANMKRYGTDKLSIYRCLRFMGRNHSHMTEYLVEELLNMERYMLTPEPMVENQFYIGILIFIFNACTANPAILSLLPQHNVMHYLYLREKYTQMFPTVDSGELITHIQKVGTQRIVYKFSKQQHEPAPQGASNVRRSDEGEVLQIQFLPILQTLHTVRQLVLSNNSRKLAETERMLKSLQRELKHIGSVNSLLRSQSEWYILYTQCWYIMIQLKKEYSRGHLINRESIIRMCTRLTHITYRLQNEFVVVNGNNNNNNNNNENSAVGIRQHLMLMRILSHAYYIINVCSQSATTTPNSLSNNNNVVTTTRSSSEEEEEELTRLLRRIDHLRRFCEANGIELPSELQELVSLLRQQQKQSIIMDALLKFINNYFPTPHIQATPLARVIGEITSPLEAGGCGSVSSGELFTSDKPFSFHSYVPLRLRVSATLRNAAAVVLNNNNNNNNRNSGGGSLKLLVVLPDGSEAVFPIADRDISLVLEDGTRLEHQQLQQLQTQQATTNNVTTATTTTTTTVEIETDLNLSVDAWSEASSIDLFIVSPFEVDEGEFAEFSPPNPNNNTKNINNNNASHDADEDLSGGVTASTSNSNANVLMPSRHFVRVTPGRKLFIHPQAIKK